ncbi:IS5 family transposase [Paenibacillus hexagrammi]|uniref:IS5 family transposase n=1 Tax=Paenibacillus hexagrammi TaxID=2908839 RepID=A0ABY3SCX0_9BACL|nr:IS5 family transposase [Paenibacillus sp. YPD9-1]UJF31652.1 IS5 family transposase [Paenibacillus sp. YPD9-1]UJF32200.1 IS5 family transposase [Paenibacillus sp. YPD9-1]UJF32696.1 IS5 family transposase [Paenibacillus sp. YPD9-1]
MFQRSEGQLILPGDFFLPFGGKLSEDNRWVLLAAMIPWAKVEEKYAKSFKRSQKGQKAVPVRVALGALIIQERLGTDDRETLQQILENPYLQYFLGLPGYQNRRPFHASLMTHFRKRLGSDVLQEVNEWIALEEVQKQTDEQGSDDDDSSGGNAAGSASGSLTHQNAEAPLHQGKLLLDATCAPADMAYPTDLSLLNDAREKLEIIIDLLHQPHRGKTAKPRTYRQKARKAYLAVSKQRRVKPRTMRKAIGKQLRFVARNLRTVAALAETSHLSALPRSLYKKLLVIQELYRQQRQMFDERSHSIPDRIVSISQPHVRPIVRGKAKASVEFGAKVAISLVNGFAFEEKRDWDNFNEGLTLKASVEAYYKRFGFYPEAVLADQIYRNRENLRYCKGLGIRLSGPQLGRPSANQEEAKRLSKVDASERNAIEGKFGEGKRCYGLGRIRARLQATSETVISMQFLVMNLERRLRLFFLSFFAGLQTVRLCVNVRLLKLN